MSEALFVGVSVPAAIVERLSQEMREVAEAAGKTYQSSNKAKTQLAKEYVEGLLEQALGGASPDVLPPPDPADLNLTQVCEAVLKFLPPDHQRLIRELAAEKHSTVVPFVMSPLSIAYDQKRLSVLSPEWIDKDHASPPVDAPITFTPTGSLCELCKKPVKTGTRFCPDPDDGTDGCGRQYARRMMREMVERGRVNLPQDSRFAPKPSALVKQFTAEHSYPQA